MSSAGLLSIKKRIESIKNTQKITKAMALISKSKYRKAKMSLEHSEKYFDSLEKITKDIFYSIEEIKMNKLCEKNITNKRLYIIFASNTGFCGGFNSSFANYLSEIYKSKDEEKDVDIIVIGSKAIPYIKNKNFNIIFKYDNFSEQIDEVLINEITNKIIDSYIKKEYSQVFFLYMKYNTQKLDNIILEKVLPLEFTEFDTKQESFFTDINEKEIILDYVEGKVLYSFYNSLVSEQYLRMQAMDAATKNAQEIIDTLSSKYNRMRQAAITQEISEIVVGAQTQK